MQISDYLTFTVKVKNVVVFLLCALIFLTGFKADYLNQIAIYNRLETPLRLFTIVCLFLYVFFYQRNRSYKISICISLYFALMYLLDWMHGDGVSIQFMLLYMAIVMFFEAQLQDTFEMMARYMAFFLGLYVVLNFLTVVLFPNGIYLSEITHNPCYFFGHRNTIVKYAIPMIACCSLWAYITRKKYCLVIAFICFLLNLFVAYRVWSGSAMISLVVMLGVFIGSLLTEKVRFVWVYVGALGVFVAISIFRIQEKFAFLIEGILHKDLSMTGRTDFWDMGLLYIKQNFVLGIGKVDGSYLGKYLAGFTTLHSFYLDMIFRGGLVLFLVFWFVIAKMSQKIEKSEDLMIRSIFLGCMGGYLCLGLVEPIIDAVFILLLVVLLVGYWAVDWSDENEIQSDD